MRIQGRGVEEEELFLKLLVLSVNLHLKVASYSLSDNSLSITLDVTAADSSVKGISELGKHVPITPGIPSLVVVAGRVPGQGLFIGRREVVLSDDSKDDFKLPWS